MRKNFMAVIEYDGTKYNGWQKQGNTQNTIQEKLEALLSKLLDQTIAVNGAGRTDKGVHAMGQCINFHCETDMDTELLKISMNKLLPSDIAVKELKNASPRFHARLNAKGKKYRYNILTGGTKNVFMSKYAWSIGVSPDLTLMTKAANCLIGEYDFLLFSDLKKTKKSTVRRIYSIDIGSNGNLISIDFTGSGFLYHMVRKLVSAIIAVGVGEMSLDCFLQILKLENNTYRIPLAPAKGLFLLEVFYK